LTDLMEAAIELALQPGDFIDYDHAYSFVSELEEVEQQIAAIIIDAPERAVELYETFLAGCYQKAEEIDDSSGELGDFVSDLFIGWVKARGECNVDDRETAVCLLAWMDDDPYGFTYRLERDVSKELSKKGRDAFAAAIRDRFEATAIDDESNERKRWGDTLKAVYAAGRDLKSYLVICEETEVLPSDCEVIANLLTARRKPEEALQWVEKGIGLGSGHGLASLQRKLLTKIGRGDEALEYAWKEFAEHPWIYSYKELMKFVPKTQKQHWHERALVVMEKADLGSAIDLLIGIKEMDKLIKRLRTASNNDLESLSRYTTEPVARKFTAKHPDVAAKVYRALGMRIVDAGKSRYYTAALTHFEQAKRCYDRADLASLWEDTVEQVRRNHQRKYSFMPEFEEIVAGNGPSTKPSFIERAKNRWQR